MSGIMGIYHPTGKCLELDRLRSMLDVLAHRGSDNADLWHTDFVGLAHRMLWTTPESLLERLPFCDREKNLIITADARIDNRDELISDLGINNQPKEKITDSQIILEAYQKWGENCPQKLLGDFSFAIWDEHQQQLFCARDCFGVKPFYYYHSPEVFTFASEIKALFCVPQVPKQINELRIAQYLVNNLDDKEITFYQDILRLPPAHSLTVNKDRLTVQKYWSLDPNREIILSSNAEYAEAYRELFTQAVKSRLRTPYPIGSMLSGGLDSSSICCTARNLLKNSDKKLHTFSGVFPGLPEEDRKYVDERHYMDAVLDTGGFIPHRVRGDVLSPLYKQDEVFNHTDEAYMGPNYYLNWAIYEQAQQDGVRVLLDGIDGDTTVSHGLECFADLARRGKWKTIVKEARSYARKRPSLSTKSIIWNYAIYPRIPENITNFWQILKGKNGDSWDDTSLINPDFAHRIDLKERLEALEASDIPMDTARQQHCHAMNVGIHSYVLELVDKGTNAFNIEPRYPFFDRRLVEFCVAIPVEQKFQQGWPRYIARTGMSEILPQAVQCRPCKAYIGKNFERKLFQEVRQTLDSLIESHSPEITDYFNMPKLKDLYQKCQSQSATNEEKFIVYTTTNLTLWMQKTL